MSGTADGYLLCEGKIVYLKVDQIFIRKILAAYSLKTIFPGEGRGQRATLMMIQTLLEAGL